MCGCLLCTPHHGPACNPGMCPDWELNQQPFGSLAGAQSTEPHQPGQKFLMCNVNLFCEIFLIDFGGREVSAIANILSITFFKVILNYS